MKKQKPAKLHWRHGVRSGFDRNGEVCCEKCFVLMRKIEDLREENKSLKQSLRQRDRVRDAASATEPLVQLEAGAHAPSSTKRWKRNASPENLAKRGGARKGHRGHGRRRIEESEATRIIAVPAPKVCPDCRVALTQQGHRTRSAYETEHLRVDKVIYKIHRSRCPRCRKATQGKAPLLPKALFGNSLLARMLVMHFEYGVTLGGLCHALGDRIHIGSVVYALHRVAQLFSPAIGTFMDLYRKSPVRHADETGWRIDGLSGWAWIFCTDIVSIFHYCLTRASNIPLDILGREKLDGVLVVDRYQGYNKAPCKIQYCYAHLLREVRKLLTDFPDNNEIKTFVDNFAPLLQQAMQLPAKGLSHAQFHSQANQIAKLIKDLAAQYSDHLAIVAVKNIFIKHEDRLFHWTESSNVPAHNNRAEQEIRRTVITRKTSLASQSELGAHSRSVLHSVIATARKNLGIENLELWIRDTLNSIAKDPRTNPASCIQGFG